MELDARTLGQVADAAGAPVEDVVAVVAAALKDAYDTTPNAQPGVTVSIDGSGRVELRDESGARVANPGFGSRATTAARQAIVSWMRDQERLRKVGRWGTLEGTPVRGVVKAFGRDGEVRLDVDGTLAVLPSGEAIAGEALTRGQDVTVLLLAANVTDRDVVKLTVSRRQPALVSALFERHLARVGSDARVVAVAREPGVRSKVSCAGQGDPRAELVGPAGMIVRSVMADLGGEKVDIIHSEGALEEFVAAALSPAAVVGSELVDATRRVVLVKVTAEQRPTAEGVGGVNLRLASKLTGARIELETTR